MAVLLNGLGGVAGFGENVLARNDDGSTAGVDLTGVFGPQGLNFFGTWYTQLFINTNGTITFGAPSSAYVGGAMGTSTVPIIAAFFADVDTRMPGVAGNVSAHLPPTPGGTSTGSNLVWYDLYPTGNGRLTVTWDDVGRYPQDTSALNAFQIVLDGTGNGNFAVSYLYESINWTTRNPVAGFSAGDGAIWATIPGSGSAAAMLGLESAIGTNGGVGEFVYLVSSGGAGDDSVEGSFGDDLLGGGDGADHLFSYLGNDTLVGGGGADTVDGMDGDDIYVLSDAQDTLREAIDDGRDTVRSPVSWTLGDYFEVLVLTGSASIDATGNALANSLAGNAGANVLDGGAGRDAASYAMALAAVRVDLSLGAVAQNTLGAGLDTLIAIESLVGSRFNDRLAGDDLSNGLSGGAGADTLQGGAGNDFYGVDNDGDVVDETGPVSDIDTVRSTISYTLGANLENLALLGSRAIDGTGNAGRNVLTSNSGDNRLDGGAGVDTASYANAVAAVSVDLSLGSFAQNTGGAGSDALIGIESLVGSEFDDTLRGDGLANVLNGRGGTDTLDGGGGNDTYRIDDGFDVISETGPENDLDIVVSTVSYSLGDNVERLLLLGAHPLAATGNALNNTVVGNNGVNAIDGGSGNDRLVGSGGGDQLIGGAGADVFIYRAVDDGLAGPPGLVEVIGDFAAAEGDRIDLRQIDANLLVVGNQSFSFIADSNFTAAGQLRYDAGLHQLEADVNGDLKADFVVEIAGVAALTASDFLL